MNDDWYWPKSKKGQRLLGLLARGYILAATLVTLTCLFEMLFCKK